MKDARVVSKVEDAKVVSLTERVQQRGVNMLNALRLGRVAKVVRVHLVALLGNLERRRHPYLTRRDWVKPRLTALFDAQRSCLTF